VTFSLVITPAEGPNEGTSVRTFHESATDAESNMVREIIKVANGVPFYVAFAGPYSDGEDDVWGGEFYVTFDATEAPAIYVLLEA
jgi:hypothetical protein